MAPRPFEFRFGVGKPDFSHSMVWKVWSGWKTADLYITARPIGGAVKVSLHAPRPGLRAERHMGFTSEYIQSRQSWHGESRHYDSWEEGSQLEHGITLEFLFRFPTAELRRFPLSQSDLAKKIVWLEPAPEGQVLEVQLLYAPSEAQVQNRLPTDGSAQVICVGRLTDFRQVVLVSGAYPDMTFENQTKKFVETAEPFWLTDIPPSIDDRARQVVGFELDGIHGITEIAWLGPSS